MAGVSPHAPREEFMCVGVHTDAGAGVCVGGRVGVSRPVPGEYGVGMRAEGLWRGQGVCRG